MNQHVLISKFLSLCLGFGTIWEWWSIQVSGWQRCGRSLWERPSHSHGSPGLPAALFRRAKPHGLVRGCAQLSAWIWGLNIWSSLWHPFSSSWISLQTLLRCLLASKMLQAQLHRCCHQLLSRDWVGIQVASLFGAHWIQTCWLGGLVCGAD